MRALLAAALALAPAVAAACPVCAQGDGTADTAFAVLAMIAAPYVIAVLVIRAIRSAGGEP